MRRNRPNPRSPQAASNEVEQLDETPLFQADVVARTVKAINYQYQRGATKIDFGGSPAMPRAGGQAKVEGKRGYYEIEAEFHGLEPPTRVRLRIPDVRAVVDLARRPRQQSRAKC